MKLTKVVTHSRKMSLCQFGNSKGASIDKSGQGRAGRILTSVLAVFIITWLPYNVLVILQVIAGDTVPDIMWKISYYLWKGLTYFTVARVLLSFRRNMSECASKIGRPIAQTIRTNLYLDSGVVDDRPFLMCARSRPIILLSDLSDDSICDYTQHTLLSKPPIII